MDDNFLFRKTKSISIIAEELEKVEAVLINIIHRNVSVFATKEEIKNYHDVKTFHGEVKYYYPISKWETIKGDNEWVKDIIK